MYIDRQTNKEVNTTACDLNKQALKPCSAMILIEIMMT